MPIIDANGVEHITATDEMTARGNEHLLVCERCKQQYPTAYWMLMHP